jgi:hypothetical protein
MHCCSWCIAVWQLPLLWCGRLSDRHVFTHSVATPNRGKRTFEFLFWLLCELFEEKLKVVAIVMTEGSDVRGSVEKLLCVQVIRVF